jgi:hypothetical protein
MRMLRSILITALAAASTLANGISMAQGAHSGPGAMRCTVVIGRLSSPNSAERMPVLSWVQGYLSGISSARSALDPAPSGEVPEYDALQPQILTLCKADPTANLYQVASRFPSSGSHGH